jgi:ABC-type phosphate transport system substrate-binding protein
MNRLQACLLASACVALAGLATNASAATCNGDTNCSLGQQPYTFGSNDVFGGGSSLVAPYWRQTSDCYADPADLVQKGSPPTYVDTVLFNWTGTNPQNCANQTIITNATTWYISTGSGSGILAVFSHDPQTFWGKVNTNGSGQFFPEVQYGLSDAGLGSTDLNVYNNGGSYTQGSTTINIAAPGAVSCTGGSTNPYPNPADCYGPLVQFPFSVDPVAIFYTNGGIYEKVAGSGKQEIDYKLNVQNKTRNGGLRLSVSSLCGIYNGQITTWGDSRLTADNNGVSLVDPADPTGTSWNVPIIPVGRSDSSGTTSIITRHLANVCAQFGYNLYTTGATTLQNAGAGSIVGNTYNVNNANYPGVDQTGKITIAPGSSGVAQYVAFTQAPASEGNLCSAGTKLPNGYSDCIQQSRVGYVGADYILPYVKTSKTNTYALFGATLQNNAGSWIAPTVKAALKAFSSIQPPQSNSRGKYCANCLNFGRRDDPTAWVQGLSPSSPLADPTGTASYAIVGTTNLLGYTCYASSKTLNTLTGQLTYVTNATININAKGILGSQGLAPLPSAWRTAINETFLTNKDGLGLTMSVAGSAGLCSGADIVGG